IRSNRLMARGPMPPSCRLPRHGRPPGRAEGPPEDRLRPAIHDWLCRGKQRTYAGGSGDQALDRVRYASHTTREQPMRIETQPQDHPTATAAEPATLLVSFELSQSKWVLTVRAPSSAKLSRFAVPARDTEKVLNLLTTQRQQVERRTARPVRIVSIYEAGLDGFWLHRWLETQGVESHVVDAASILGPQRRRNAKT